MRSGVALAVLLAACGSAPRPLAHAETPAPDAGLGCRPATYRCSVLASWSGAPARGSIQMRTGDAPVAGEIVGTAFRCALALESLEPGHHLLRAKCAAGDAREVFELHEPTRAFHTHGGWTLEPACWYAQRDHVMPTCDTCREVDYCEGPDVGFDLPASSAGPGA